MQQVTSTIPSIAVVIPNWNDSRYLRQCLDSVLEQATPPDEVVVIDDCSTDDSVSLIRDRIKHEDRVRFIVNSTNLGTYGAFNVGLQHVRSDYVLPLASNDFVLAGIFGHAKTCLAKYPGAGLWSAMALLVDENDKLIRFHPSAVIALRDTYLSPEQCVRYAHGLGNWFTGPTLIYNRGALGSVGGFDPQYKGLSDLLTALAIAARCGSVFSPEPFGATRIHREGFLSRTLADSASLETLLGLIQERGQKLEPRLYTTDFCRRFALRMRFAVVRSGGKGAFRETADTLSGGRGLMLRVIDQVIPGNFRSMRLGLAFFLLRPFDVWPAFWYRFLGSLLVRLKIWLRPRTSKNGLLHT